MMRPRPSAIVWMILAFAAALTLTVFVLAELGAGQQGTTVALQATARLSFLLFWPAYAGGALTALFGSAFQPLKQRTREFGLAFASAHLVHIGLVGWLCHIGAAPSLRSFIFFGIAVVWTYLLALFSIGQLQTALGPNGWWVLRVVGLNYIAYAFAVDFLKHPLFGSLGHTVAYLPFAAFSVVGPMLRLAAFLQRTGHRLAETGRRAGSRSRDPEELMRSATARD